MDKWRMWLCSARRDSPPHTAPRWHTLWAVWKLSFPLGLRTWWYKEPCVVISTPLLISCGPLSPDPLAGLLLTSQDGEKVAQLGGGRETGRQGERERGRERREECSHLRLLSQEFRNKTTAKASEASYQMLLFLGSLKIKLVVGWARCPSGCCRKQEGVGVLQREGHVTMGTTTLLAGLVCWLPLRRN